MRFESSCLNLRLKVCFFQQTCNRTNTSHNLYMPQEVACSEAATCYHMHYRQLYIMHSASAICAADCAAGCAADCAADCADGTEGLQLRQAVSPNRCRCSQSPSIRTAGEPTLLVCTMCLASLCCSICNEMEAGINVQHSLELTCKQQ